MQARCPLCEKTFTAEEAGVRPCPHCGQQISLPLLLESAGGEREDTVPWERRHELGLWRALFQTWQRSMFSPRRFWSTVSPTASWVDALLYAWLLNFIGAVLALPFAYLQFRNLEVDEIAHRLKEPLFIRLLEWLHSAPGLSALSAAVLGVFLSPLGFLLAGTVMHLGALLLGASRNGFNATLRAWGYAQGPGVVAIVPCFGFLAALYVYALTAMGLSELQKVSLGRAAFALSVIPLLCCCCVAGAMAMAGIGLGSLLSLR